MSSFAVSGKDFPVVIDQYYYKYTLLSKAYTPECHSLVSLRHTLSVVKVSVSKRPL